MMKFPKTFIAAGYIATTMDNHVAAPYFRKCFEVKKQERLKKAHILITGLGFYELYLNGERITKGFLSPYITAPDDIVAFDEYDVSSQLKLGKNVIGIMLGNGMQNTMDDIWEFEDAAWVGPPQLAMSMELEYESGKTERFESDTSFKTAPSPIVFDSLRHGEIYDANKEIPEWNAINFDDSNWTAAVFAPKPAGEKTLCTAIPIKSQYEISPCSITPYDDGFLYDFGLNLAGIFRLNLKDAEKGQKIEMYLGEWLEDGKLSLKNIQFGHRERGPHQRVIYNAKGKKAETYTPTFTYFGYQYIFVKGVTAQQATKDLLTYIVLNTDLKEMGNFESNCEILNKLQQMTRYSTLSNFHHFPTDCPHREKNGWTGDAALSCEHTLLNLNPEQNYVEWLKSVRAAQREDGALPGIVPTGGWGFTSEDGSVWNGPAWDCALTYLPYYTYVYRGGRQILEDNATAIFRYIHYLSCSLSPKGLVELGLGDWCPADNQQANGPKATVEFTDSVISLDVCKKAAFIFDILDQSLQRDFAHKLACQLKQNIRTNLIDFGSGLAQGSCQTTQAMGIFYDVFEEGEKPYAFEKLIELIEENNRKIDVGILGARVIFHVLAQFGRADLAYEIITSKEHPSYGNWVERGYSTLPEAFLREEWQPWSLNHHFFGDISNFFITSFGGIRLNPTLRDVTEVNITPQFIDMLSHVNVYHNAPAGKVSVEYHKSKEKNNAKLEIAIPEMMHGKIILPKGCTFEDGKSVIALKTGTYNLKFK